MTDTWFNRVKLLWAAGTLVARHLRTPKAMAIVLGAALLLSAEATAPGAATLTTAATEATVN